jgi:Mrp family chromosome partitioning ATPase
LQAQVIAARQREAGLQSQLASQQRRATDRSAAGDAVAGQIAQLETEADAERTLYRSLLAEANRAGTDLHPTEPPAHVLAFASPPAFGEGPRPLGVAALGLFGGLGLGACVVLLRRKRTPFADPADIRDDTGLDVLGVVPRCERQRGLGPAQVVIRDPSGPVAEALRALRANLRYRRGARPPRTVLFAAAVPGEGASSVAAAFARVAARDRFRVLLIECDLVKPSLARLLDAAPASGALDALAGREHSAARGGLDYLVGGGPEAEAGRLLESMSFTNLLAEATESYNLIVLDAQAVSAAPDALVLAHAADAALLVVKAHATPREDVQRAIGALLGVSRQPPAVVLNAA